MVIYRAVAQTDIPQMAAIRAEVSGAAAFWSERIELYLSGKHSPQHALPQRAAFVARVASAAVEPGQVVGFVAGHRTTRFDCSGELQWIDVAAEWRGQSIADELIRRMGDWFVEHDARRICVNVAAENVRARRLYARHGAIEFSESWMLWEDARRMT